MVHRITGMTGAVCISMASFRNTMPIWSSWCSPSFWLDAASMTPLLQQLFFVGGDQVLLRGTSNMPSTSWRAFRDLGSTTGALRFFRTKDDYWIAFLVLLSRVPQFEDVLLLRLPDRAALARARPQYLQDAYQQFLAKERVTLSQIDSMTTELPCSQRICHPILRLLQALSCIPFLFIERCCQSARNIPTLLKKITSFPFCYLFTVSQLHQCLKIQLLNYESALSNRIHRPFRPLCPLEA